MKKICLLLSAVMAVTAVGAVPVSAKYDRQAICSFESFSDYNTSGNAKMPVGWTTLNDESVSNGQSYRDETRKSTALKISGGGEAILPFGANFDSGYMHLGFDVRSEGNYTGELTLKMNGDIVDSGNAKDAAQYDYTKMTEGYGRGHNMLSLKEGEGAAYYTASRRWLGTKCADASVIYNGSEWHRVDILLNKDTNHYFVYYDGQKLEGAKTSGEDAGTAADAFFWDDGSSMVKNFKGVVFQAGSGDGGVLLDNVYINRYEGESFREANISLTSDDMSGMGISPNGSVNAAFSEWMSTAAAAENITVTDKNGNEITDYTVTGSDNMQFTLKFGNLDSGDYTITVNGIEGAVSGKVINAAAKFTVNTEEKSAVNGRNMIFEENFNTLKYYKNVLPNSAAYNGDNNIAVPIGWADETALTYADNSKYTDFWNSGSIANYTEKGHGIIHLKSRGNGDNALELSCGSNGSANWGRSFVKYFTNGIAAGDFTLEFDVFTNGGGWSVGLVDYDNYDAAYTYGGYGNIHVKTSDKTDDRKNYWTTSSGSIRNLLSERVFKSPVVGMLLNDNTLKFTETRGGVSSTSKTLSNSAGNAEVSLAGEVWTNIKIKFDTDSNTHTVYVTPEDGETQQYTWADGVQGRFEKGVMGVVLSKLSDTANSWKRVSFDNIKVYKDNSRLIEQNFNSYTGSKVKPGGWYKMNDQLTRKGDITAITASYDNASSTVGKSGETDDKALELKATSAGIQNDLLTRLFDKPAYGGKPVAVEFDLKTSGTDAAWQLHQINQSQIFELKGYNAEGCMENDSLIYTDANGKRNLQANSAILGKAAGENVLRACDSRGYGLNISGTNEKAWDYTGYRELSEIDMSGTDGEWQHYRVIIKPVTETRTDYIVYVGEGEDVFMQTFQTSANSLTTPAAGVGFIALNGGSVSIDNLIAYEAQDYENAENPVASYPENTSYTNASVTGVSIEYADGLKCEIGENGSIGNSAKRIAVSFSAPIAMPDGNEVSQPLNSCMTSTKAKSDTSSEWSESDKVYFNVYDTVDNAVKLRRLYSVADRNIDIVTDKYLSADRKTLYIELDNCLLTDGKEYVLTINPNITFANSVYSKLDAEKEIHFYVNEENEIKIGDISIVKQVGDMWVPVNDISAINSQTPVKISIKGCNPTGETVTAQALKAKYADGAIKNISTGNVSFEPKSVIDYEEELTFDSSETIDTFRYFLWNLEQMTPYGNKAEAK